MGERTKAGIAAFVVITGALVASVMTKAAGGGQRTITIAVIGTVVIACAILGILWEWK